MFRLFLIALAVVIGAFPAMAQSQMAQQCAAFGEAQYRKLSQSIDRVTALDFPPPALERVETRAGSQSVTAALTLRGKVSYRSGPPFETHFVCLLDAQHKPLFFYALPALATRASPAPTPIARAGNQPPAPVAQLSQPILPLGAQPPAPAVAAAAEPRPPLPAGTIRLRGLVRNPGGKLQFLPCDGAPLPLEDRTRGQELTKALNDLTSGQEGRPMFVEMYGGRESGPGAGISALELRRASVETAGCRERFDQREWTASGNEPSWRLEVTTRDLVMSVLGGNVLPRMPHGGLLKEGDAITYAASDGSDLSVTISERRCIDSQSGSVFAYAVEVRSEGRAYNGCAAHNPAMPAP
jgi:uncharacterized membrane protein